MTEYSVHNEEGRSRNDKAIRPAPGRALSEPWEGTGAPALYTREKVTGVTPVCQQRGARGPGDMRGGSEAGAGPDMGMCAIWGRCGDKCVSLSWSSVLVQRICCVRVSTNFAGGLGPERDRLGVVA